MNDDVKLIHNIVLPERKVFDIKTGELSAIEIFIRSIRNGIAASEAAKVFKNGLIDTITLANLDEATKYLSLDEKMRVYGSAVLVSEGDIRNRLEESCFHCVQEMVEIGTGKNNLDMTPVVTCNKVETCLPLRVNWCGTWTDAPPYCLENGGAVVNAAVKINNMLPVKVVIEKIKEPKVVLEYFDSGNRCEYFTAEGELSNLSGQANSFLLLKTALAVCGLIASPKKPGKPDIFDILGGGLFFSAGVVGIPMGSGLGTSSILLAACIKGLFEFLGYPADESEVFRRVLLAEQIMGTGGGWQDQAGGMTDGIKLVSSSSGYRQNISILPIHAAKDFLNTLSDRFCLVYSGKRILGRTVLREIMGGYIRREPVFLRALEEIHNLPQDMKINIESGNIDSFVENMNRQTELTKMLNTGYLNEHTDLIMDACKNLTDSRMICGAGGGGFLQFVLKQGCSRQELNHRLKSCFPQQGIEVWDCVFFNGASAG